MTLSLAPPLDPAPDEARSLLRRELVRPEYHEQDLLGRIVRWIRRVLEASVETASGLPPLTTVAAMLVLLLLVVGSGHLLSRARRTRSTGGRGGAVLPEETVPAVQVRARAEAALDDGRPADALVEGYRALALRQVELGVLEDRPGATAHEVALALSRHHPRQGERLARGASLFDAVLYGGRPATVEQARAVLALDDELVGVR